MDNESKPLDGKWYLYYSNKISPKSRTGLSSLFKSKSLEKYSGKLSFVKIDSQKKISSKSVSLKVWGPEVSHFKMNLRNNLDFWE